jgi:alkylation response protein AidB-like acyl-CoA dehydrogenase
MPAFADSPQEATFRKEVREFIDKECPPELKTAGRRGGGGGMFAAMAPELAEANRTWRKRLASRGWLAPAWPKEYGGAGMSHIEQFIFNTEMAEARIPGAGGGIAFGMAGPTIIVHGTEEQKQDNLPGILSGEVNWCQLWSEPGAGSDLASLQTRAVRDGDEYVINGQKIWTSGAQTAHRGIMLARTNPEAPKHRGITFFIVDMKTPGITVSPLTQMTGQQGFNQVFFDNVRVPAKNVVGEVDRGWYVNTTTLDFERSSIGTNVGTRHRVHDLVTWAREEAAGDGVSMLESNPLVRLELADRMVEAQVALMLSFRVADMQNRGLIPNHEASMGKMYSSELGQRLARTEMKLIGLYGTLMGGPRSPRNGAISRGYLGAVSATIAGGTSEIQRNILAQRGLGLPRD